MTFVGARYLRPLVSRRIRIHRRERRVDLVLNTLDILAVGMVTLASVYFGGWFN